MFSPVVLRKAAPRLSLPLRRERGDDPPAGFHPSRPSCPPSSGERSGASTPCRARPGARLVQGSSSTHPPQRLQRGVPPAQHGNPSDRRGAQEPWLPLLQTSCRDRERRPQLSDNPRVQCSCYNTSRTTNPAPLRQFLQHVTAPDRKSPNRTTTNLCTHQCQVLRDLFHMKKHVTAYHSLLLQVFNIHHVSVSSRFSLER